MSKASFKRILSGTVLCAVLGLGVIGPFGAWAQQQMGERGGMLSTLRLSERLLGRSTSSPDPAADGVTTQALTTFDYTFSTETRTEMLTFDASGAYRFADGPATDGITAGFTDPALRLRYDQTAAAASLMVVASAAQQDLADISPLSAADSSGEALPPDLADLQDGGTRRQLGFNTRLSLRDDAPFGWELGLRVNDIAYADLPTGSSLKDSIGARADVIARFDITPVLQTRAGVHYSYTQTDGAPQTDRYGLQASASLARPNGAYTLATDYSDGDGGAIAAVSLGRSFELPRTKTDIALGMTRASDATLFVTGSASLAHEFGDSSALGPLTLAADRSVTLTGRSDEEVITSLSLGGSYALSPVARLRVSAELGQAEEVATGDSVTLSEAALALNYDLGRDWRAGADIRAKSRNPSGSAATDSTSFGISLTRRFEARH